MPHSLHVKRWGATPYFGLRMLGESDGIGIAISALSFGSVDASSWGACDSSSGQRAARRFQLTTMGTVSSQLGAAETGREGSWVEVFGSRDVQARRTVSGFKRRPPPHSTSSPLATTHTLRHRRRIFALSLTRIPRSSHPKCMAAVGKVETSEGFLQLRHRFPVHCPTTSPSPQHKHRHPTRPFAPSLLRQQPQRRLHTTALASAHQSRLHSVGEHETSKAALQFRHGPPDALLTSTQLPGYHTSPPQHASNTVCTLSHHNTRLNYFAPY